MNGWLKENAQKPSEMTEKDVMDNQKPSNVMENESKTVTETEKPSFPYIFFTEITHFCDSIKSLLPSSEKEIFHKNYVEPLLSRNYETTMKAKYTLNCEAMDMKIEIYSDSESPVPTPMIMFTHGDRFEELYDKLFNKWAI